VEVKRRNSLALAENKSKKIILASARDVSAKAKMKLFLNWAKAFGVLPVPPPEGGGNLKRLSFPIAFSYFRRA